MIDKTKISLIKSATIAIGLVDQGKSFPKVIVGSGFLYDGRGYLITAGHVAEECVKLAKSFKDRGNNVELAAFRAVSSTGRLNFETIVIDKFSLLEWAQIPEGAAGPSNLDVACGKPKGNLSGLPFLQIKESCKVEIADELIICGYPGGTNSLSLTTDTNGGMRFSPVAQFGRVAGLMPNDDETIPYGVQTDIIGTGGSSGSPILNDDGMVIAIAQAVIPSSLLLNEKSLYGIAKIGLIHGITSCTFYNFANNTTRYFETGISQEPIVIPTTTLKFKGIIPLS